jgi:hypothetical protein
MNDEAEGDSTDSVICAWGFSHLHAILRCPGDSPMPMRFSYAHDVLMLMRTESGPRFTEDDVDPEQWKRTKLGMKRKNER